MVALIPEILFGYLLLFRPPFTKPSFVFFSGYILSLLLTSGRKTMSRVAQTCFWVERHLASKGSLLLDHSGFCGILLSTPIRKNWDFDQEGGRKLA